MWLSENPAKRYYERQMLLYQPLWISVMALVVMTHAYEHFGPWEYLIFGIIVSLPTILIPLRFPCPVSHFYPARVSKLVICAGRDRESVV